MRYYFDEAGCDTIGERYQYGLRHFRSKLGGFLLPWVSAAGGYFSGRLCSGQGGGEKLFLTFGFSFALFLYGGVKFI